MLETLLIPASAIANRYRGGGVYGGERIKYRKLVSGIALGILAAILAKNVWVFPIILGGWYMRNIIGTGYLFNALHGWTAPKWRGVLYGTARGLLTLATTIPLAYLAGNWWLAAWGLIGALQGCLYYLGGKLSKNYAVTVAEYLDGLLYGGILAGVLWSI